MRDSFTARSKDQSASLERQAFLIDKLIYRGAEADVWNGSYLGLPAVKKIRTPKKYRIIEIDEKIRQERTKKEANIMLASGSVVACPAIYDVDTRESSITMQLVHGTKVKDLFEQGSKIAETSRNIGMTVKRLHNANIVHNDLTTSNIIRSGNNIFFIDFGLAERSQTLEDKATDLLVFKKMLKSTHFAEFKNIWKNFIEAYKANAELLGKIYEIEKRARYAER